MELKLGYKQSLLGIVPEDWDVMTLSDVCHSICDGTHFTPRYVSQGIPFYSVENITANDFENTKYISEKEHATLIKRCKPERGDILMTRITAGVVGDTRLIDWDVNASIYVSLALLKPNNRIESEYLYRYSRSPVFIRETEKRALTNATPKKINMQEIGAIPIPVPRSVVEQRAIATALGDVDALLNGLARLITKKRDLKHAAIQQLLTGKTRLPGFNGKWEVKKLENSADCLDNVRVPMNEAERSHMQGDIPYCGANGVLGYVNNYVIDDDIILMAEDGGYFDEYEYRPIAYRMIGKCWVNNHAHILKAKPGFDQGFLFYSLVHKNILPFLASGTRAKLNKSELNKIEVNFPLEKDEQAAIAAVLSDMDTELACLEQRRNKTKDIKHAMMQELLTGKTRLVRCGDCDA